MSPFSLHCQLGPAHTQASGILVVNFHYLQRLGSSTRYPAPGPSLHQGLVTSGDRDFTTSKAKKLQTGLT